MPSPETKLRLASYRKKNPTATERIPTVGGTTKFSVKEIIFTSLNTATNDPEEGQKTILTCDCVTIYATNPCPCTPPPEE